VSRWTRKRLAMCQENIRAARVGDRAVDGRRPRWTSHVAWSIVKKVLQNLTSLFSKMTSRIEERAQERMTKRRRMR